MTYISAASNIRFDKRDIEIAKLNGVILYEKETKAEDIYIEYQVIDTDDDYAFFVDSLPKFYLKDGTCIEYSVDGSNEYHDFFEKIEITLKDGNVVDRILSYYRCDEISNVKLWYPKSVVHIQFDYDNEYCYPRIESMTYCNTRFLNSMRYMFIHCIDTTSLDLSNFDTYRVTDMCMMFSHCYSLIELDLSNFNMINVTDTDYMFGECTRLEELRLDNCNKETIQKIIESSYFPTGTIDGKTRKIYVKKSNAGDLEPPKNWIFEYIPEVLYDEPTEALLVPESMTQEAEERLTISQATYDPDNENLNI